MTEPRTIPDDYRGVTAYLVIKDAAAAIDFYTNVLGAEEKLRLASPDEGICHAELAVAGGTLMLAEEVPEMDIKSPTTLGGSGTGLLIYVGDPDAVFDAAIEAGATQFKPVADQFYGERSGTFDDPFGHRWTVAHRRESISNEEIKRRFDELYCDE